MNKYDIALNEINKFYGDLVSIEEKAKTLNKFGRNIDLATGSYEQIWITGGLETLSTTNDITHVASSNTGDTQQIVIEGHTLDGNNDLTFVTQTITLAGQTKTPLTTPLARATRLYNNSGTSFVGTVRVAKDVTFTDGVPASDIHITVQPADNQTLKAATSISKLDYWIITHLITEVERSVSATVDFRLQIRRKGNVFRTLIPITTSSSVGANQVIFDPCLIVPPNTDVRVTAQSSANNTVAGAMIGGILAGIIIDR